MAMGLNRTYVAWDRGREESSRCQLFTYMNQVRDTLASIHSRYQFLQGVCFTRVCWRIAILESLLIWKRLSCLDPWACNFGRHPEPTLELVKPSGFLDECIDFLSFLFFAVPDV